MIIATRTLTYASDGNVLVQIDINAPEKGSGRYGWFCAYTIGWPHGKTISEGWGLDPVQALMLTFEKIGVDIYVSAYHESGKLYWEKPSAGYGFPVPKNGRDWLIGDDALVFG